MVCGVCEEQLEEHRVLVGGIEVAKMEEQEIPVTQWKVKEANTSMLADTKALKDLLNRNPINLEFS